MAFVDQLAYPHAKALAAALGPALLARGLPGLEVALVVPGQQAAFDYLDAELGAFGWVRVTRLFPSRQFPYPDNVRTMGAPILLAQEFEVGVVRRVTLGDNGEAVPPEVQEEEASLQLADMNTILTTICGYFGDIPILIGDYTPYGPTGAVVGGWWTVTAQTGVA